MSNEVLVVETEVATLVSISGPDAAILVTAETVAELVVQAPSEDPVVLTATQDVAQLVISAPVPAVLAAMQQSAELVLGEAELLAIAGSDNVLSVTEKKTTVPILRGLLAEAPALIAQATALELDSTTYSTAVTDLDDYLATLTLPVLWSDHDGKTYVDGETLDDLIAAIYAARGDLNSAMHETASTKISVLQAEVDALSGGTISSLESQIADLTTRLEVVEGG